MLRTDRRTHPRSDNMKTVYPPQTKFAGCIKKQNVTDGQMDSRTHRQRENSIPPQTKFAGGIINFSNQGMRVRMEGLVFTIH